MKITMEDGTSVEGEKLREISRDDWVKEGTLKFGPDMLNWKFVCPNCGNIQSVTQFKELKNLGIAEVSPDDAYTKCIGRVDTRIKVFGTIGDKIRPCNYTMRGLFCFADTFVINDGKRVPVFEFAEPA